MMADRVRNGWFINLDGLVFVVINGSPYEVDASKTPLGKLPPGSYTDEQVEAALLKLEKK